MQAPPPEGAFLYVAFFAQFKESDKTGLMYYNARYYDPRLGRFITADSEIPDPGSTQSFNRYMYVLGNPVRYNDPSGHEDSDGPGAASPASPFAPNAPGHVNSGGGSGGGYYNVPYTRYEVSPVKNGTFNYGINIKAVKTIRTVNYEHNSENINPANETSDCSGAKSISKIINKSASSSGLRSNDKSSMKPANCIPRYIHVKGGITFSLTGLFVGMVLGFEVGILIDRKTGDYMLTEFDIGSTDANGIDISVNSYRGISFANDYANILEAYDGLLKYGWSLSAGYSIVAGGYSQNEDGKWKGVFRSYAAGLSFVNYNYNYTSELSVPNVLNLNR